MAFHAEHKYNRYYRNTGDCIRGVPHRDLGKGYACLGTAEGDYCALLYLACCGDPRYECAAMDLSECHGDRNYGDRGRIPAGVPECPGAVRKEIVYVDYAV